MLWTEVADGVFLRRYASFDLGICVVRSGGELLVVDSRANVREADELLADLAHFAPGRVRALVNTHAHFDHTFGNQRFGPGSALDVPIVAHRRVPAHLERYERPMLAAWVAAGEDPAWAEVELTPPTELVDDRHVLDVGGRAVELRHFGRGHTDNDLVLHVPDAGAWLVGDLLEESAPPMYGTGCHPLDWPGTMAALLREVGDGDVVVPGHGRPVDRAFAVRQQAELDAVASLVRELHAAEVPADEALAAGGDRWPYPADGLRTAVAEAYRELGT